MLCSITKPTEWHVYKETNQSVHQQSFTRYHMKQGNPHYSCVLIRSANVEADQSSLHRLYCNRFFILRNSVQANKVDNNAKDSGSMALKSTLLVEPRHVISNVWHFDKCRLR